MELPDTLAPWAPYLRLFDPPLGLALGETVRRLAMLLGPLPVPHPRGDVPDGYDGLARRGPYERLLASEWVLATAMPNEFIRRAAMGEHAFLAPAFRGTGGSRLSVALFDTGPDQLGAPRVAQIAALVVLAQRAEAARVPFAWGVLAQPASLLSGLTAASLLHLVQGRAAARMDDVALSAWRDTLTRAVGEARDGADVWIVGGAAAAAAFEGASSLRIDDVLELGARRVSVETRPRNGPPRSALLELPPVPDAIRVLRDPFRAAIVTAPLPAPAPVGPVRTDGLADLVFSYDARRLLTLDVDGQLTAHFLPNSPFASYPPPARFRPSPGHSVVAAGQTRSGLEILTSDGEHLWRHELGPRGGSRRPARRFPGGFAPALHRLSPLHVDGPTLSPTLVLVDAAGALRTVSADQQTTLARAPLALWRHLGSTVWATESTDGIELHAWAGHDEPAKTEIRGASGPVFFGYWGPYAPVLPGMIAARTRTGWTVRADATEVTLLPSSEDRVIGVGAPFRNEREPCLLVIRERTKIRSLGRRTSKSILTASAPIVRAVVSPYGPHVAYVTEAGELVVHDLLRDGDLVRVRGRAP
jgi:hypothetical protein